MLRAADLELPDGPQLEVDLGCGDAAFLLERAQSFPDRLFVGLDRDESALARAAARAAQLELDNLQLAAADLTAELDGLFFAGRVHRLHLHFPEAWLTDADRLAALIETLEPWGELFVQTEQPQLAGDVEAWLDRDPRMLAVEDQGSIADNPFEARSARERELLAAGGTVHRLLYCREDDGEVGDDGPH